MHSQVPLLQYTVVLIFQREHQAAMSKQKGGAFKLHSHPQDFFDDNPYYFKSGQLQVNQMNGMSLNCHIAPSKGRVAIALCAFLLHFKVARVCCLHSHLFHVNHLFGYLSLTALWLSMCLTHWENVLVCGQHLFKLVCSLQS